MFLLGIPFDPPLAGIRYNMFLGISKRENLRFMFLYELMNTFANIINLTISKING